jgi:hypothetical protein
MDINQPRLSGFNTIVVWVCWGDSWLVLSTCFNQEKNGGYDEIMMGT